MAVPNLGRFSVHGGFDASDRPGHWQSLFDGFERMPSKPTLRLTECQRPKVDVLQKSDDGVAKLLCELLPNAVPATTS